METTTRLIDEVQTSEIVDLLEALLTRAYAIAVMEEIKIQSKLRSVDAEHRDNDDDIDSIYTRALSNVLEDRVVTLWRNYVANESDLKRVNPLYFLKYQCRDYRDTRFKTDRWHSELKTIVLRDM